MRLTGILSAAEDRSEVNVSKLTTTPTQPVVRIKIGWQQKSHCTLVTAKWLASATCSRPSFSRSVPVGHNRHVKGLFLFSNSTHQEYGNVGGPPRRVLVVPRVSDLYSMSSANFERALLIAGPEGEKATNREADKKENSARGRSCVMNALLCYIEGHASGNPPRPNMASICVNRRQGVFLNCLPRVPTRLYRRIDA